MSDKLEDLKELRKYESDNFAVRVRKDTFVGDFTAVSVTHNGNQWTTIQLNNAKEIIKTIEALQEYLGTLHCCKYCGSDNPRCQCWNDS